MCAPISYGVPARLSELVAKRNHNVTRDSAFGTAVTRPTRHSTQRASEEALQSLRIKSNLRVEQMYACV